MTYITHKIGGDRPYYGHSIEDWGKDLDPIPLPPKAVKPNTPPEMLPENEDDPVGAILRDLNKRK